MRELANVIEHATILCDSGTDRAGASAQPLRIARPRPAAHPGTTPLKTVSSGRQTLREIEMQVIYQTLERLGGNKPKAAEELGISLKTLYNKLNQSSGSLERSA